MNTLNALKVLLAMVAVFHIVIGLAAIFVPPGDFAGAIISSTYGASFDIGPVTHHIVRILGAFMIFVGVMAVFAFLEPERNKPVVYALIILFLIRVRQRIIFADELGEHFDISTVRLVTQSIFFVALAATLFYLRPKADSSVV